MPGRAIVRLKGMLWSRSAIVSDSPQGDRLPSHAYEEWALREVEVGLVDPEGEVRDVARVVVGAEHGVRLVRVHLAQVPHLVRARVRRALRVPLREAR